MREADTGRVSLSEAVAYSNRLRTCTAQRTSHALCLRIWIPVEATETSSSSRSQVVLSIDSPPWFILPTRRNQISTKVPGTRATSRILKGELLYGVPFISTPIISKDICRRNSSSHFRASIVESFSSFQKTAIIISVCDICEENPFVWEKNWIASSKKQEKKTF